MIHQESLSKSSPSKPSPNKPDQKAAASGQQERVIKNSLIYLFSQLISWGVAILSISLIPRAMGQVGIGQMALANTTITTVGLVVMLSIEQWLPPEIGRNPKKSAYLLRCALGFRLLCMPVFLTITCLVLYWLQADRIVWILSGLNMAGMLMGFLYGPIRAALSGWEDARSVSLGDMWSPIAMLLAVPFLKFGVVALVAAIFLLNIPVLVLSLLFVRRKIDNVWPVFDRKVWARLVQGSMGFLVIDWSAALTAFSTVLMLKQYGDGEAAVGVYSQAQRLQGTFLFIPSAIGAALLPSLARLAGNNRAEFRSLQQRITTTLVVMGMPIVVLAITLAEPFCAFLYGKSDFQALPITLKFCALGIIPLYVTMIAYRFLVAEGRNAVWGGVMLTALLINIALCRLLIPWTLHHPAIHSAAVGATLAFTTAEIISMALAIALLKINLFTLETGGRLAGGVMAALAMSGVICLTPNLFFVIRGALGMVIFGVLCWKWGVLGEEEQAKILSLLRRKFNKA